MLHTFSSGRSLVLVTFRGKFLVLLTGANGAGKGAPAKKAKGAKPEANGSHAEAPTPQLPPLPTVEDVGDIEVRWLGSVFVVGVALGVPFMHRTHEQTSLNFAPLLVSDSSSSTGESRFQRDEDDTTMKRNVDMRC